MQRLLTVSYPVSHQRSFGHSDSADSNPFTEDMIRSLAAADDVGNMNSIIMALPKVDLFADFRAPLL